MNLQSALKLEFEAITGRCARCLIWRFLILTVLFSLVWPFVSTGSEPANVTPPNVVLIFVDNVGYGDFGCYGNRNVKTPNIDRFAAQGVRCTDFYIASPSCSPSRGAILTGRHPERTGLNFQLSQAQNVSGIGLRLSERTLPQYLKPLKYATAAFGKWNIGFAPGARPTDRGFDVFFGHASGNIGYFSHLYNYRNDMRRGTEEVKVKGYSTDLFAQAAIDFIERHAKTPFFVYLPFNAAHFPATYNFAKGDEVQWEAPDEYLAMYGIGPNDSDPQRRFYAVMSALDAAIGRVLDCVDRLNLKQNTLAIVLSDNGAFMLPGRGLEVQSNQPLRDGGITCYEGGIRVPCMVRWPGHIKSGTICSEMLSSLDLLPMIVRAAGGEIPDTIVLDGKDPTAALAGESTTPHNSLCWVWRKHQAIRGGRYKIVRPSPDRAWELYDLKTDIGETLNLADRLPSKVNQLRETFESWHRKIRP